MTYVSKKEKVFDLPDQDELSSISLTTGDNKLKSFLSVSDRRAWTSEEFQRYQHLYGLVKDSESNISKSSSFKYIPFDVLLAILMAEKDAYIQELLERQEENRSYGGKANVLYKSDGYEDSDDDREALIRKDAEVVALKNKIVGLGTQLEDYKETLMKAMHKLENMDAVMSENNLLKEKIKCSEEAIKCLESKKEELEKELEYYKTHFSHPDEEIRHRYTGRPHMDGGDCDQIMRLSSEKDILIKQIEDLQKELEKTRAEAAQVEILRKASETTSNNLEEISKENKCYKAKLESMKCLELYVEELKKQAHTLTDKYKRESIKASDQLKQISVNKKELQILREERDKLSARVNELTACESQYLALKGKLQQVELIIDENEMLNKKLLQLDRLELENEQLKLRIEQMKSAEFQALEDKKLIMQLQCEVAHQEEEIKRMLKHIDDLSSNYPDDEIYRLQLELEDKNGKLKKYERQLDEIPILESEIEELKHKLQKCIDDFGSDKELLRRLQEELEACRNRCHELEEMAPSSQTDKRHNDGSLATITEETEKQCIAYEIEKEETGIQSEMQEYEDKWTYTIDETAVTLQHVEEQNRILKNEVASLTLKLSKIDLDELIVQTNDLKVVLSGKDERIQELETEINALKKEVESYKTLKQCLEQELELYKERTEFMTADLSLKEEHISTIEETVILERKERVFATGLIRTLEENLEVEKLKREAGEVILKLQKEESNLAKQEMFTYFEGAMDHQKGIVRLSKKLNEELQTENEILKEMKEYVERCENQSLKNLVSKLRAEVNVLKSFSKPELESECESLQIQVNNLLRETDILIAESRELKSDLDSEKKAKDFLEKEVMNLQAELSTCVAVGNEVFGRELSSKEALIHELREELAEAKIELQKLVKESEELKEKNEKLTENVTGLEAERKDLKNQINLLQMRQEELNKIIEDLEEKEKESSEKVRQFEEVCAQLKVHSEELSVSQESVETLREGCKELEQKEKEIFEKVKQYEEVCTQLQNHKEELSYSRESVECMQVRVKGLEEELKRKEKNLRDKEESLRMFEENSKLKDEELELARKASFDALNELNKLNSEMEDLRRKLTEREQTVVSESPVPDFHNEESNYENDLQEKLALEEALRKMESELDDLKTKLEECRTMEEEMANLRSKRDSLLEKMAGFESEIDRLKKKLTDFESLKDELNQLKSRKGTGSDMEMSNLHQELLEKKTEIQILKTENENLKEELHKKEGLLEICKNFPKNTPETPVASGMEFFTPPAMLSPHSPGPSDVAPEYISLERHRKEISDVENKYQHQIRDLREANTERLKKLTEHYEKESRARTKSFAESINSVRSCYENDIKKLVEKHKLSIMRLQGLHEDEVQELNTSYETQMEAMQTQNENLVNDIRTETAEKFKQLREQHNRDLRELARKYEDLLRESEARFKKETGALQDNGNAKEIDLKEDMKQFYQNSIAEMQEKHTQELKKCKKSNLKRIELMKNKYEALLVEERKKYEEQLEEMLLRLKTGQSDNTSEAQRERHVRESTPSASPGLEFTEVLHKILNEGLECLSFDELILVHSKTCFIPENSMEGDSGVGEYSPRMSRCCKHRELMAAEKEELLKRIFTLEHEIVIKQLETHEAIVNMEAAEFCRIRELKSALCAAQQKNAELRRLLSDQSKNEMGLKIDRYMSDKQASFHETNVVEKVKELEREKAEKRRLEEELQKERTNSRNLATVLETEKERHMIQRKRDADYVESIRQRLEEALNHEQKMETQLDYEVKLRARLEAELQGLRHSLNFNSELPPPTLQIDTKAVKDIKNLDQSEVTRKSRHSRSKSKRRSKLKSIDN